MSRPLRPQLTLPILGYALFDVAGMLVFATGAAWFSTGKPLFLGNFPTNAIEALLATLAGIALMLWAAAQILREMLKQRPATEEKTDIGAP